MGFSPIPLPEWRQDLNIGEFQARERRHSPHGALRRGQCEKYAGGKGRVRRPFEVSGFTLFSNHVLKSTFCDAHHILKTAVALDSAASIRFIGSREVAMTLTEFFVRADATPLERRGRSVWRLFLDRIVEGRMRKAEREIVEYFQRPGREMPPNPPR